MKNREFEITLTVRTNSKAEAKEKIKKALDNFEEITAIKCLEQRRTSTQNRALHLYFTLLAVALNDSGADMRTVIRRDVDMSWSSYNIKEFLWRPLQKALLGKKSTATLKTNEIDEIYDILNKTIGERTGVTVEFPSINNLLGYDLEDKLV